MALEARRGYRSGKAFEVGVYDWIRGGTIIENGALTERDGGVDRSRVASALNDGLTRVIMAAVGGANRGGRDRLTTRHDFTWPASTECLAVQPSIATPPGAAVLTPALTRPLLDVIALVDRSQTGIAPEVEFVPMERFDGTDGPRWSFSEDCIYFALSAGSRSPGASRALRLVYVGAPDPIDIDSDRPRTDIPIELHRAIELWAAKEIMTKTGSNRAASVADTYEAELAEALARFRPAINASRYARHTRPVRQ